MPYGVLHAEIFKSSLARNCGARWIFQDLVILADESDNVMMDLENLSYEIRAPVDVVSKALDFLMQPDRSSKSTLDGGRRVTPILNKETGVTIGYHIVNRHHYKRLMSRARRREYMRQYRARKQEEAWRGREGEGGAK